MIMMIIIITLFFHTEHLWPAGGDGKVHLDCRRIGRRCLHLHSNARELLMETKKIKTSTTRTTASTITSTTPTISTASPTSTTSTTSTTTA